MRYKLYTILFALLLLMSSAYGLLDARCSDVDYVGKNSDRIVIGRVIETKSFLKIGNDSAYTLTSIAVSDQNNFQAETGERILIQTEGGEVNGFGQLVEDQPTFRLGELGRLYLKREILEETRLPDKYSGKGYLLYFVVCGKGIEKLDTSHNQNDNVCCISNEGNCLRNIPSANSNQYQKCYVNEDCYDVPECSFGCCKVNFGGANKCTYTTASSCQGTLNRELLEKQLAIRITPAIESAIERTFFAANNDNECQMQCNRNISAEYRSCAPDSLLMVDINETVGGRFSYVDEMYYDKLKKIYLFFLGGSFFIYDNNLFRNTWYPGSIREFSGGRFDHIDAIIDNYPFRYHQNTTVYFVGSQYYIFDRIENDWSGPFELNTTPLFGSAPSFDKVDAALYYDNKYYFVVDNAVLVYTPPRIDIRYITPNIPGVRFNFNPVDVQNSTVIPGYWDKLPLSSIIGGCNTLDALMSDNENIYISKGKRAWIIKIAPRLPEQRITQPSITKQLVNRGVLVLELSHPNDIALPFGSIIAYDSRATVEGIRGGSAGNYIIRRLTSQRLRDRAAVVRDEYMPVGDIYLDINIPGYERQIQRVSIMEAGIATSPTLSSVTVSLSPVLQTSTRNALSFFTVNNNEAASVASGNEFILNANVVSGQSVTGASLECIGNEARDVTFSYGRTEVCGPNRGNEIAFGFQVNPFPARISVVSRSAQQKTITLRLKVYNPYPTNMISYKDVRITVNPSTNIVNRFISRFASFIQIDKLS